MTPQQALELFRNWSMEVVAIKHLDTFNQAYVALSKLINDASKVKPEPEPQEVP
jgi:hypothetical protein